ncbi:pentatricopeptide repeat-containing protein At3g61520, mitochondrial [Andrographis paniculata]|uniref:pentatricopeptide repeat-containing protein At3g61520, mitochondrial n=1 Tax=Andrographis paniculata TaxID=175694 RepID=UPI0021E8756D|nr:pentatricopeptide repeat-containing protein At3g61520, mitochondrial [Andrographis paniculata]
MRIPLTLNPPKPPISTLAAFLRRLSADASSLPSPPDTSAQISHVSSLLQTADPNSWSDDPNLRTLISSLSAPSVLRVARRLPNYQNALQFYHYLKAISEPSDSLSLAFQAVLELAMRENPDSAGKLKELFLLSKDQNIPISVNSATLLVKCFGEAQMLDEMVMVIDSIDREIVNADLFNLVIAGYMKWGRIDDALKVLENMLMEDSSYPPNSNTASIVLNSILKRNSSGRKVRDDEIYTLFSKFREHGVSINGYFVTEIVIRFCSSGELDKAWSVFREAMNSGYDVSITAYNNLLTFLSRKNDFGRMNLLMKEMKEKGIKPDVVTCGIVVKHLCRSRRVDEAMEFLEKMTDEEIGVTPDTIMYNTIIDGLCKVGRWEEGLKVMEKMSRESKCSANTVTYNCMIDGVCKAGEIEKGLELFEEMRKHGVEVNAITLNTLLDGMCKNGRVGSAMELFDQIREKGLKANARTYTILITAFCNVNNIDKAMKLFDEVQTNGLTPDAVVFYTLIGGLTRAGKMDDAVEIVSKMKEGGFNLDIIAYNNLIGGFCRKNRLDKASEMLESMEKDGLNPDRVTYNTLISYFCAKGDFDHAHKVMKKMIDDGLTPDAVTYGALIHGYCSNGNLDKAKKLFTDMGSSSKVPPNTVIYNMLIDAFCKKGDVDVALSLMDDMKGRGVCPNSTTYNALFKGLREKQWLEKAFEYMDRMTEEECSPDYITMEILTEWLPEVGEIEKFRKFAQGDRI